MMRIRLLTLIVWTLIQVLAPAGCKEPRNRWLTQYVQRTKFLYSIARAMDQYEETHGGQAPQSLEELRPILETIDPEGLRADSKNERMLDRAVLVRNFKNNYGTQYEWIVAVLLNPKIRDSDSDTISFADKYVVNGEYVTGLGGAFLGPDSMGKMFGKDLVEQVYRKDREVRTGGAPSGP